MGASVAGSSGTARGDAELPDEPRRSGSRLSGASPARCARAASFASRPAAVRSGRATATRGGECPSASVSADMNQSTRTWLELRGQHRRDFLSRSGVTASSAPSGRPRCRRRALTQPLSPSRARGSPCLNPADGRVRRRVPAASAASLLARRLQAQTAMFSSCGDAGAAADRGVRTGARDDALGERDLRGGDLRCAAQKLRPATATGSCAVSSSELVRDDCAGDARCRLSAHFALLRALSVWMTPAAATWSSVAPSPSTATPSRTPAKPGSMPSRIRQLTPASPKTYRSGPNAAGSSATT